MLSDSKLPEEKPVAVSSSVTVGDTASTTKVCSLLNPLACPKPSVAWSCTLNTSPWLLPVVSQTHDHWPSWGVVSQQRSGPPLMCMVINGTPESS